MMKGRQDMRTQLEVCFQKLSGDSVMFLKNDKWGLERCLSSLFLSIHMANAKLSMTLVLTSSDFCWHQAHR